MIVLKVTAILIMIFLGIPMILLYLTGFIGMAILGMLIGLLILQYITRNGHAMSDADI